MFLVPALRTRQKIRHAGWRQEVPGIHPRGGVEN